MSCKVCEDYLDSYPIWFYREMPNCYMHERSKFCPNCGEPLTQPEPLSPDELKVWLCTKDWIYIKDDRSETMVNTQCWLIDLVSDKALKAVNVAGKSKIFFAEDYGKTWVAYARKPRGG